MTTDKQKEPSKTQRSYSPYLKYSGLAMQMLLVIGVAIYSGHLLDAYLDFKFPVFLLLFMFTATAGIFYKLYRSIQDDNAED